MKYGHRRNQKVKTGFAIITVSDSRSEESDESGRLAKKLITREGHKILAYKIVKNDKSAIQDALMSLLRDEGIWVIVTSGGTGISKRDVTVDVLSSFFEKTITGFGEFFRRLSQEEVGEAAILSRATAGIIDGRVIFCLPGSKNAIELALNRLILPCLGHLLWEANR